MAENIGDGGPLPPGWDCKFDMKTGRHYYINYFNKSTTWDDPRLRYKPIQQMTPQHVPGAPTESIPLQPGTSPDLRGYYPYHSHPLHFSTSHQTYQQPNYQYYQTVHHPLQDLTNVRPSPIPSRAYMSYGPGTVPSQQPPQPIPQVQAMPQPHTASFRIQETSLTTDPEQAVTKISAMFPTVSETHIRMLLKKYHNREAVVVSALQVEKHPISTPGPFTTPPLTRHFHATAMGVIAGFQMTPPLANRDIPRPICSGSPTPRPGSGSSGPMFGSPRIGDWSRSPRPHSSPKMKLRYLKSVFPTVEETLLLDILANADNNVQKATEKLLTMGFDKRDTPPPRLTQRRKEEEQKALERRSATPTPPPRMKSSEEKQKMKQRLEEKYKDIPERVVTIALDSVDFDEERAAHILQTIVQEESKPKGEDALEGVKDSQIQEARPATQLTAEGPSSVSASPTHKITVSRKSTLEKGDKPQIRRFKGKKDVPKISRGTSTTEDKEYKSPYLLKVSGPDPENHKGPNDDLLLVDYVVWNGPDPELRRVRKESLAKGPDSSLREERTYIARGPNKDLRKGPAKGLARGSIYSQLNRSDRDTRGK